MDDFSRHLIKYQTLIQQRKTIRDNGNPRVYIFPAARCRSRSGAIISLVADCIETRGAS